MSKQRNNVSGRQPIRSRTPSPYKRTQFKDDGMWTSDDPEEDSRDSFSLNYSENDMTDDEEYQKPNHHLTLENISSNSRQLSETISPNSKKNSERRIPKGIIPESNSFYTDQNLSQEINKPKLSSKTTPVEQSINMVSIISVGIAILVACFGCYFCLDTQNHNCGLTEEDWHNRYPKIDENVWSALQAGVEKVKRFETPSVFIYLYNETMDNDAKINEIIASIADYAVCSLRSKQFFSHFQPIIVPSTTMNSAKAIGDYGSIIEEYRHKLEENGVIVFKNLELIDGRAAPAFHTICDEYTPFVPQSVIFFTMHVEEFEENSIRQVERILREKWSVLEDDIFDPLFTRISSMVYKITV